MRRHPVVLLFILSSAIFALPFAHALPAQQAIDPFEYARARQMLRDAYEKVKKNYYDPKFHGLDWDARYRDYDEQLKKATTLNAGMATVAAFLEGLHDSHTYFQPPSRPYRMEYGYRYQIVGDNAYVTLVRPGTDAESKVNPGDQVLGINGFGVNRDDVFALHYFLNALAPQTATKLLLRNPAGQQREIVVATKMKQGKQRLDLTGSDGGADIWQLIREEENEDHLVRERYADIGDVMIWKMPEFFLADREVDRLFDIARKHKTLILDLRGNPGGAVDTLDRMIGNVFDHDIKIGERIGRKPEMKPQLAKTRGKDIFTGQLMVLIDSSSASAAELFARVMQLEERGKVLGDRSSGSVMESRGYGCAQGTDTKIFYSFSVTDADLIMKDGKSLEHVGVIPDEIVLPTAADLAAGRDPGLARAAQLAGLKLDSVAAGKLFPFEWRSF